MNYGFRHQFRPDKEFTDLSKSIGIAEAISFSIHDHALKGQVNSDFVQMDKHLIKVIATSFTTSSYKPGKGVWDIPDNPTKKISRDDITTRLDYDEKRPALMEILSMNIWILSKFLYEEVSFFLLFLLFVYCFCHWLTFIFLMLNAFNVMSSVERSTSQKESTPSILQDVADTKR